MWNEGSSMSSTANVPFVTGSMEGPSVAVRRNRGGELYDALQLVHKNAAVIREHVGELHDKLLGSEPAAADKNAGSLALGGLLGEATAGLRETARLQQVAIRLLERLRTEV